MKNYITEQDARHPDYARFQIDEPSKDKKTKDKGAKK